MGMTPEGKIQKYTTDAAESEGFLVRRLQYIGRNGAPDLLIVCGFGVVGFCEVKKDEDTPPEPHQTREHIRLKEHGAYMFVVGTHAEADAMIRRLRFYVAKARTDRVRGVLR